MLPNQRPVARAEASTLPLSHALASGIVLVGLLVAPAAAAPPDMSVSFGFEPRLGTYDALDDALRAHHYAPVDSPLLPAWGLRGRVFFDSGVFAQLAMSYGLRVAAGTPAPTTTTLTETAGGVGYRLENGLFASLDAGFSAVTQSVSSALDGGALVYLGPSVHPRVGWSWLASQPMGWFVAVSAGINVHLPIGASHSNPMWETSFDRGAITAFTLGIESGLGRTKGK